MFGGIPTGVPGVVTSVYEMKCDAHVGLGRGTEKKRNKELLLNM